MVEVDRHMHTSDFQRDKHLSAMRGIIASKMPWASCCTRWAPTERRKDEKVHNAHTGEWRLRPLRVRLTSEPWASASLPLAHGQDISDRVGGNEFPQPHLGPTQYPPAAVTPSCAMTRASLGRRGWATRSATDIRRHTTASAKPSFLAASPGATRDGPCRPIGDPHIAAATCARTAEVCWGAGNETAGTSFVHRLGTGRLRNGPTNASLNPVTSHICKTHLAYTCEEARWNDRRLSRCLLS